MIWLSGILCFAIGICLGAALYRQFGPEAARLKQLEQQLDTLANEYKEYKNSVHTHFNTTAELFHNLTDCYRDFYNHLATGARSLCPDSVYSQLTLAEDNRDILTDGSAIHAGQAPTDDMFSPPPDYTDQSEIHSDPPATTGGKTQTRDKETENKQ